MITEITVFRVEKAQGWEDQDRVAEEVPLTVYLNGQEVATLLSSPSHWEELAAGFLFSQGVIKSAEDILRVGVDPRRGLAWVEAKDTPLLAQQALFKRVLTSGCGTGVSMFFAGEVRTVAGAEGFSESAVVFLELAREFQGRSETYRATGGVHSAALAEGGSLKVFREDIGRHNAVDKVIGHCLLNRLPTASSLLLTTGRASSEIVIKAARLGVPILVSRSAPTSLAVNYARELGITLVGFARGRRLTVYAHHERIKEVGEKKSG
jgi:FdhD protein